MKRKLIVVGIVGLAGLGIVTVPLLTRDQVQIATKQSTVIETPEVLPVPEGMTLVSVKGTFTTVRTNENTPPGERERFNAAFTREPLIVVVGDKGQMEIPSVSADLLGGVGRPICVLSQMPI